MPPADLREDYAPFSYRLHAELVDAYWAELTYGLLRQLVVRTQDEGQQAFRELKTSYGGKFPLERDSQTDLTAEELAQTASLLSKVRPQEKFNANIIGGGAQTGLDAVDPLLAQLRGIQMPAGDSDWFERVERTFEALPRAHEPYYCRITLLGAAEQDRLVQADEQLLLPFFRKFRLLQGTDTSKQLRTSSPTDVPVDDLTLKYPGPPVRVEFYKLAGDTEPNTGVTFSEPWACLRMLRQCHDERKSGYVKLNVEGEEGQGGVLYLLLEFFADNQCSHKVDMPTPDQWPSLKQ
jgi:hypothetical protein